MNDPKDWLLPCPTCNTAEHLTLFNCHYNSFNPVGVKCSGCGREWETYGDSDGPEIFIVTWYNKNRMQGHDWKLQAENAERLIDELVKVIQAVKIRLHFGLSGNWHEVIGKIETALKAAEQRPKLPLASLTEDPARPEN